MLKGASTSTWRKLFACSLIIGFVACVFLMPRQAFAATGINPQLNFQGRLYNAAGATVPDGFYNIQFKIYQDGTGTSTGNPSGTLKWTEDWINSGGHGVRVVNGFISVQLGSLSAFGSSIDWDQDTLWLSMNIGNTNISCTPFSACSPDGEMVPMKRLSSTPYAMNAGRLGGLTSSGFIQNQNVSAQTTSNFWISGTGIAATLQAATIDSPAGTTTLNIGTTNATAGINLNQNTVISAGKNLSFAAGAGSFDQSLSSGTLKTGTGAVGLNGDVTVAASKSITITGGATGTRPASPTEGMVYYDTTTKQLLTYANGKWQADRSTATKIVGTSASGSGAVASQAPDAADYVNTSTTSAQTVINSALSAVGTAGGGTVYLMEGTYIVDGVINIPSNVTLAGSGAGTIIKNKAAYNNSTGMLQNSDPTNGNDHITVQDLKLDGNKSGQSSGTGMGIYFVKVGGGATTIGAHINNIWVENFKDTGIQIDNSSRVTVTGVSSQANDNNGLSFYGTSFGVVSSSVLSDNRGSGSSGIVLASSAHDNTFTGNTLNTNASSGITISGNSYNNVVSGNNFTYNDTSGISLTNTTENTITGNTVKSGGNHGIRVSTSSNNIISNNTVSDNGRITTGNNAIIVLNTSLSNQITGNKLTDTAGTGYAIEIQAASNYNTIGGNLIGTGANGVWNGAGAIVDSATGTIWQNQTDNSGNLRNSTAKTSGFFQSNDSTNNTDPTLITKVQGASTADLIQAQSSAGAAVFKVGSTGIVTYTSSGTTGANLVCQNASSQLAACTNTYLSTTTGIQLQAATPGTAQTGHFNITGTGIAGTSLLTPLLDTASAVALNIGTSGTPTTTQINLNQNVAVAAGKNLTIGRTGTGLTNAFNITGYGGSSFNIDTTDATGALKVQIGDQSICSSYGRLCVQQSLNATGSTTNTRNQTNITTGAGGQVINTTGQLIVVNDATSYSNIITGQVIDLTTNVTNNNASTYGMIIKGRSQNAGNLFDLQSSGTSVLSVNNAGLLTIGNYNGGTGGVAGKIVVGTTANANTVTLQSATQTGNYTLDMPALAGNATICTSNSTTACGNFIQNQNAGAQSASNFWLSGTGRADTSILTPTLDTATGVALNIGTSTASSITIGKAAGTSQINLSSSTINLGIATAATTFQATTQSTAGAAGSTLTIQGATSGTTGAGGVLALQGGNSATGTTGGNVTISGGTGSAANGLVVMSTPTFSTTANDANCYTGGARVATDCTIAASSVNNSSAVIVGFSVIGKTATLPDPTILTAGRVVYVTAANTSSDFTLSVNGGGQANQIAMRQNTTATMIWNGSDWTAAGASSSTTLQSAYDNTLQSAGGAELIVSRTSNTNGLTIRDSSTNPVNDTLLSVQTASAASLFSINSNVTEYASNAGAETAGGSSTTFPASTWSSTGTATVTRQDVAGNYIATGQGSVLVTPTAANSGAKNQLSSALTANTTYNVSFTSRLTSGSSAFTDMNVQYSQDGGTSLLTACTTGAASKTSVWTKVNCTFTTPATGITSGNAILIRQTASATRTFYVDNLSVTIAADYNFATDGDVGDAGNFATNWTAVTGGGTVVASRDTTYGYDASDSAKALISTSTAGAGIRNKLSANPLATTPGKLYRITVYASSSTAMTDFTVRYSRDGGTNFDACTDYNTQTLPGTPATFTKVTCYITASSTAATNPYVYFTQAGAAIRSIYVDAFSMTLASSTTPNVQVGGGINGGPTTLFTLDKGASAPIASDNEALLGSMYYDTTLGKLQCYEADGWGACGSSPDNIVTISPEYTNAVLHGTGVGTMTSDVCSDPLNINDGSSSQPTICGTNETYNFYKWTSPQATPQTYSIYLTYQLPSTFKSFASGQTSLKGRTDSANSTVNYQIYRNNSSGLTACGSTVSVSTGAVGSWQTGTATGSADPSTCSFAPNESIVFKINIIASQNANAYVGNLGFTFSNR